MTGDRYRMFLFFNLNILWNGKSLETKVYLHTVSGQMLDLILKQVKKDYCKIISQTKDILDTIILY